MSDINPFENPPLYEASQVILLHELVLTVQLLYGIYLSYSWWNPLHWVKKYNCGLQLLTIEELVLWLAEGKKGGLSVRVAIVPQGEKK